MRIKAVAGIFALLIWPHGTLRVAAITKAPHQSAANNAAAVQAVKTFLYALFAGDAVEFEKAIIPEPGSGELLRKKPGSAQEIAAVKRDAELVCLRQVCPFLLGGKQVGAASGSKYFAGTKTIYTTQFRETFLVIPVACTETGWKVDVRFWLAEMRQARSSLQESDPEVSAKAFLYFLLAKQPKKLAEMSASKIRGEDYTESNHLPGGDMDQVLSLCIEMPVVRAREGETFTMPSGETVRADARQLDTMVVVGMYGMIELAFELKRVDGRWKVVPQRYFEFLRAIGAI